MKVKSTLFLFGLVLFAITAVVYAQYKGPGFSGDTPSQANWYSNSVAFVVGIDSYSNGWGRLSAGVSDAKKMASALRSRGFTVFELYDRQATMPAIVKNLRKAARQTNSGDRFIFYYSGHGHTELSAFDNAETGYLVPVEGHSGDPSGYIPMRQIKEEIMNHCKAKHVLVVVDSCFSGNLLTRSSIPTAPVADYLNKKGIYGITAGMANQVAVDGLFTNVLVEGLNGNADFNNDGYITFKELGMYAENNVRAKNRHQTPDYGVMYGAGQFVFAQRSYKPRPPAIVATPPQATYVTVKIFDDETSKLLPNSGLLIKNLKTGKLYGVKPSNGIWKGKLPPGDYTFKSICPWYEQAEIMENTENSLNNTFTIRMSKLELPFNIIFFDHKSDLLSDNQFHVLDKIIDFVKNFDFTLDKIIISGHSFEEGSSKYSNNLSERRAIAVKNYLIVKGLNPDLLVISVADNANPRYLIEGEKEKNRRVEITFIRMNKNKAQGHKVGK